MDTERSETLLEFNFVAQVNCVFNLTLQND